MSGYTQLSQGQRYKMEALRKAGHNQTMIELLDQSINQRLAVSYSVEILGYRPKQAHETALQRLYGK
jgi:hypothetical protein